MQQFPFIGKVLSLPSRVGKFRVYYFDEDRVVTLNCSSLTRNDLWMGDGIRCVVSTIPDSEELQIVVGPELDIACDKESFERMLLILFSGGTYRLPKIQRLYQYLYKSRNPPAPFEKLSSLASRYKKYPKSDVAKELYNVMYKIAERPVQLITSIQAVKLLEWWNNSYDYRRLKLIGITKGEIDCEMRRGRQGNYHFFKRLATNPYAIPSIDIKRCLDIDSFTGRVQTQSDIYCGNIIRRVDALVSRGSTCVNQEFLTRKYSLLSNNDVVNKLKSDFDIVFSAVDIYPENDSDPSPQTLAYTRDTYRVETEIVNFLVDAVNSPPFFDISEPLFENSFLDDDQKKAIRMTTKSNVTLITGPAGSGKTTTVKALVDNLSANNISYIVTSFTGKAVVRAKELNGIGNRAATLHRILFSDSFDAGQPKVIIIDEATMVGAELFLSLLKEFKHKFMLVLIGDVQQLPPIAYGSIFLSLVQSRSIPCVYLTNNHRVVTKDGTRNGIILNATRITEWPEGKIFPFEKADNFLVVDGYITKIMEIVKSFALRDVPCTDVTIITPYKADLVKINTMCQLVWNKDNESVDINGKVFFVGDRVMMNENNYDIDVFNGQEGIVTEIQDNSIIVDFPTTVIRKKGTATEKSTSRFIVRVAEEVIESYSETEEKVVIHKLVSVPFTSDKASLRRQGDSVTYLDVSLIDLCFALTIHKSQGSEWPFVIFFVPSNADTNTDFLMRNLCYTALTRARDLLILLDKGEIVSRAIAKRLPYRCEGMTSRLMAKLPRLYHFKEKVIDKSRFVHEEAPNLSDDDWF